MEPLKTAPDRAFRHADLASLTIAQTSAAVVSTNHARLCQKAVSALGLHTSAL